MGGGFYPAFLRIIFTAKTIHFQVWSRGHQIRGHPYKLEKFAIFYHAKKSKNLLLTTPLPDQKSTIKTKVKAFA